jgi:hypothetical protein
MPAGASDALRHLTRLPLPLRRYWIGYTTQNGNASTITGTNLGAVNSSRSPYLHFGSYNSSATRYCVAAGPQYAYHIYEWWWVPARCWRWAAGPEAAAAWPQLPGSLSP